MRQKNIDPTQPTTLAHFTNALNIYTYIALYSSSQEISVSRAHMSNKFSFFELFLFLKMKTKWIGLIIPLAELCTQLYPRKLPICHAYMHKAYFF